MPKNKSTFLSRTRIQGDEIFSDVREYLNRLYRTSNSVFTPSSPYGQILLAVSNIGMLILLYLEDVAASNNFITATSLEDIYGTSQLAGHDPYRGVAAKGEISFRFKPGKETEFPGPHIIIKDKTELKCLNNNLTYTLRLPSDEIRIMKDDVDFIHGIIVQGTYESQRVLGQGNVMQTFNINIPQTVDHDEIKVKVNGVLWKKYKSIYDMNGREVEGVVVRTGLAGGIDLIFGNGYFGKVPEFGAVIEVEYLTHNGTQGILDLSAGDVSFEFNDDGFDFRGDEVDLNEFLNIDTIYSPKLGADPENTEFTKHIAPLASKSFALVTPENYEYFLSRYNSFSYIEAYNEVDDDYLDDNNVTYLFLLPDVRRKLTSDLDYFTLPKEEFTLTQDEIDSVLRTLNESGQQATTSEVEIVKPVVKEYAINVVLRYFENYNKDNIRDEIRTQLNDYFLENKRRDKIPKSDLIAIIEDIEGVDSVNVFFVSRENEEAIRSGYYIKKTYKVQPTTPFIQEGEGNKKRYVFFNKTLIETKINLKEGEDPGIGLDDFGDISIRDKELPIIKGGWSDRNNTYYNDVPVDGQPSSLSIYFKEKARQSYNSKIKNKHGNT